MMGAMGALLAGLALQELSSTVFLVPPAGLAVSAPSGTVADTETPSAVLLGAMRWPHEARPHGLGDNVDWAQHPRIGMGRTIPAGWNAMTAWGQIYLAVEGSAAKNVRVQIRDMRAFMLRRSDHRWVTIQRSDVVEGGAYREDFAGDINVKPDIRPEPDGGISIRLLPGYNFHFWPSTGRAVLDPGDIGGFVVTYRARLILDDPRGPDDRDRARIVASVGGDYWQSRDARWDQWKTNGDFAIGQFRLVRPAWRLVAAHTFSEAETGPAEHTTP
jgi:hypothetical protein